MAALSPPFSPGAPCSLRVLPNPSTPPRLAVSVPGPASSPWITVPSLPCHLHRTLKILTSTAGPGWAPWKCACPRTPQMWHLQSGACQCPSDSASSIFLVCQCGLVSKPRLSLSPAEVSLFPPLRPWFPSSASFLPVTIALAEILVKARAFPWACSWLLSSHLTLHMAETLQRLPVAASFLSGLSGSLPFFPTVRYQNLVCSSLSD